MINRFLRILFPESCPICQKLSTAHKTAPICPDCWESILPYNGTICRICGKPLVSDVSTTCGECYKDEPVFKSARSFGLYEDTLKKAINLLKFYGIKRLSKPLSEKILQMKLPYVDLVIPVPLHKKRLRQREFNQSALLAKHIAKRMGIPLMLDSLIRSRNTMPQVGLNTKERKRNIRKAFEIRDMEFIKGKSVMLVDDVYTTGATIRECSGILKKAGAREIYAITITHGKLE